MVNINIKIPEELHKCLKLECLLRNMTLKEYITFSLQEHVKSKNLPNLKD